MLGLGISREKPLWAWEAIGGSLLIYVFLVQQFHLAKLKLRLECLEQQWIFVEEEEEEEEGETAACSVCS